MQKNLCIALVGTMLLTLGLTNAQAQDEKCTCVAPSSGTNQAVGEITSAQGQVSASAASGLVPAGAGTKLYDGSQVITGLSSSAQLSVGTCKVSLKESSEVTITDKGSELCVAQYQGGVLQQAGLPLGPLAGVAVVGGIIAIGIGTGGGDDPVSQ